MSETLTAAVYARKSSDDERSTEDGRSVDRQITLARAFAARKGWLVAEGFVIAEQASGADFTRPGLRRLLDGAQARPRPFDAVIVMSVDRLGREQVRMSQVVQQLYGAGIAVWTYQDGQQVKFSTPIEKLMLGVSGFSAEEYRHQVKLKTRESLVEKAKRGHATGQRTYGYALVRVGDHSERQIDEAQAAVVRRVFEMAAAGLGDLRIVRTLAAEQVPAPGRGWSKLNVRHMLRNPLYVGRLVYGKTTTVDDGAKGRRVAVPKDDWTAVEVPGLRILSDALWESVQRRKAKTRAHYLRAPDGRLMGKPEAGLDARHLLNGIARCGECGGSLTYMVKSGPRYFCTVYRTRGTCRNGRGIPAHAFEGAVCRAIYRMLVDDREHTVQLLGEHSARIKREQAARGGERKQVEHEVARLEAEIERLVGAIAAGKASSDIVTGINERRGKVEELRAKLRELAAAPPEFDKASYLDRLAKLGVAALGPLTNPYNPTLVRQVLRAVGVTRIVARREPDGWSFEGMAHLDKLVSPEVTRDARPPPSLPQKRRQSRRSKSRPLEPRSTVVVSDARRAGRRSAAARFTTAGCRPIPGRRASSRQSLLPSS